jgi:selenocysteine lyase/cysteine desulfurase
MINLDHAATSWPKPHAVVRATADFCERAGGNPAYGNYTDRDILTWARETEKSTAEGSRSVHRADELGREVSGSCDMGHPHTAHTPPETYPKF